MSSTTLAAPAAASPLFAAALGVGTTPPCLFTPEAEDTFPAPLFPQAWQRALVVLRPGDPDYGQRVAQFGTVTFVGDTFFHVLLDGAEQETIVTDMGWAQWDISDTSGTLPTWFLTQKSENCALEKLTLEAKNYDLILHDGCHVRECFFKKNRFLEIAGQRRYIALADVARLRPSL